MKFTFASLLVAIAFVNARNDSAHVLWKDDDKEDCDPRTVMPNVSATLNSANTADLTGLDPNALRGWHVHESGNLTDGCTSAGGHLIPSNLTHGAPDAKIRHVGDLGNLQTDSNGNAKPN
ncbi:superoxide dismutase [Mucidula mucida]|nr:superoxide dismutase [Mucidula mucida]